MLAYFIAVGRQFVSAIRRDNFKVFFLL